MKISLSHNNYSSSSRGACRTWFLAFLLVTSFNRTRLPAQDSGCAKRTVPFSVVDQEWNLVRGLSAANFRGSLHGQDVQILSAAVDTSPRHIVLLLDASGSIMGPDQEWMAAKSLSEYLIRFAPVRASIAQMAFSSVVLDTVGFEED